MQANLRLVPLLHADYVDGGDLPAVDRTGGEDVTMSAVNGDIADGANSQEEPMDEGLVHGVQCWMLVSCQQCPRKHTCHLWSSLNRPPPQTHTLVVSPQMQFSHFKLMVCTFVNTVLFTYITLYFLTLQWFVSCPCGFFSCALWTCKSLMREVPPEWKCQIYGRHMNLLLVLLYCKRLCPACGKGRKLATKQQWILCLCCRERTFWDWAVLDLGIAEALLLASWCLVTVWLRCDHMSPITPEISGCGSNEHIQGHVFWQTCADLNLGSTARVFCFICSIRYHKSIVWCKCTPHASCKVKNQIQLFHTQPSVDEAPVPPWLSPLSSVCTIPCQCRAWPRLLLYSIYTQIPVPSLCISPSLPSSIHGKHGSRAHSRPFPIKIYDRTCRSHASCRQKCQFACCAAPPIFLCKVSASRWDPCLNEHPNLFCHGPCA